MKQSSNISQTDMEPCILINLYTVH